MGQGLNFNIMKYRRVPKVYKDGNVYWHVERYKNDQWVTVIPYLSIEEAIYLMDNPNRIDYFVKVTKIAEVGVWAIGVAIAVVLAIAVT